LREAGFGEAADCQLVRKWRTGWVGLRFQQKKATQPLVAANHGGGDATQTPAIDLSPAEYPEKELR